VTGLELKGLKRNAKTQRLKNMPQRTSFLYQMFSLCALVSPLGAFALNDYPFDLDDKSWS
jgi:hypothetical protein